MNNSMRVYPVNEEVELDDTEIMGEVGPGDVVQN